MKKNTQKDPVTEYEEQGEKIIEEMMRIVFRAERKVDDIAYRKVLEKLK